MRRTTAIFAAVLAVAVLGSGARAESWIDLSHPLDARTLYWPGGAPFELEVVSRGRDTQGRWYAANVYRTAEHLGTHLDAPFHFNAGGWKSDEIPIERMRGPAFVLDMRAEAGADADLAVSASQIRNWERRHRRLPAGGILLVRTGWDARWGDAERYFGSTRLEDASDLHFPGLAADAAALLVERRVHAVGIDTASIDPGPSRVFEAHRKLAAANVLIYENLRGLGRVPGSGAEFMAFALSISSGTGGPVRAVVRLNPR